MFEKIRDWLGFGNIDDFTGHAAGNDDGKYGKHGHAHAAHGGGHGHTHGVIDASITATERGVWAVKWSFIILAITAAMQFVVVLLSNSVALLADMIHNVGDATTAIPLWIAFVLARRKPSKRFTYGLGRVEDLAGLMVVGIILFSAIVAGYEAIDRLLNPHLVVQLGWLAVAGFIGFLGNEIVAVFRIRVGRQLNSAALVADGYHARTDGLTSLAVVLGAFGVWMGYPLADPIIGLLITITIFGIVWQSARAVITRTLDGVDPGITDEARHAAGHVAGVRSVNDVKARWIGHELSIDLIISVDESVSVAEAEALADRVRHELADHIPALSRTTVTFGTGNGPPMQTAHEQGGHHHAPEPFHFSSPLGSGILEIVDTAEGERMRLTAPESAPGLSAIVRIKRDAGDETIELAARNGRSGLQSMVAPEEPHEFHAELELIAGDRRDVLPFRMVEPADHQH